MCEDSMQVNYLTPLGVFCVIRHHQVNLFQKMLLDRIKGLYKKPFYDDYCSTNKSFVPKSN